MSRFRLENFYIHSGLFAILSLTGAVINYALYPVLTRVMNTQDFGDFATLLSISNQVFGILLAFNITSIYLVKKYPEEEAREMAQLIQKFLLWFFIVITLILFVLSPLIRHWLHISDLLSFGVLAIFLVSSLPAVIWTGYLQGHKQLVKVGLYNLISSILKFVFTVVLASYWGVRGGLLGVLISTVVGLVVLRFIARMPLPSISSAAAPFTKPQREFIRSIRMYIINSIFVVGMLSILQNIDITFAKALFSPSAAGVYSGISVLSNAIYFVSFLLIWILLPEISLDKLNHNRRLLRTAYSLLGAIAAMAITVELVFRNVLTHFLLGSAFNGQGSILVIATLFQLSLIAITLYAYYSLVMKKRRALLLSGCVFISTVAGPLLFSPANPRSMITTLLASLLSGCVIYSIISTVRGLLSHGSTKYAA